MAFAAAVDADIYRLQDHLGLIRKNEPQVFFLLQQRLAHRRFLQQQVRGLNQRIVVKPILYDVVAHQIRNGKKNIPWWCAIHSRL